MAEKLHIIQHDYSISRTDRELANGHKAACLWFTGLSGSGKSTLANLVEKRLFEKGIKTFVLDGDNVRSGLNKGLTFSVEDRNENLRRIGEMAKLMCDAGLVVMAAFITPYNHQREILRTMLGENFSEIYVDTSLQVCEQRDVKGLYKKARIGEIKDFTGINSPFEVPGSPDIHVVSVDKTLEQWVDLILEYVLHKIQLSN